MAEIVDIFTKEIASEDEVGLPTNEYLMMMLTKFVEENQLTEFLFLATTVENDIYSFGSEDLKKKDALWLLENARLGVLAG